MSLPRKIYLLFIATSAVFFLLIPPAKIFAATNDATQTVNSYMFYGLEDVHREQKKILEQKAAGNEVFSKGGLAPYDFTLLLTSIFDNLACSRDNPNPKCQKQAALPTVQNLIAQLYLHPPADFVAWAGYELNQFGIVPKAYAQGIGIPGLAPLLPLWSAFRNISYSILVIIMVAIGFMVIFRMKIDPKTVISIQAALPKIITTLLLITFSYAIAGFLIDLMYLLIFILIAIMAPTAIPPLDIGQQQAWYTTGGLLNLGASVMGAGMIGGVFWNALMAPLLGLAIGLAGLGFGGAALTGNLATLGFGLIQGSVFSIPVFGAFFGLPLILLLIVVLGLLFTFIRIFMLLLNAYIQIVISVIFAPIQILPEAIPGQSAFSGWIRNLLAQLITFPTTIGILMLGSILVNNKGAGNLWMPPLIGINASTTGNVLGTDANPIAAFIGMGIIFSAPSLIASIKKLFQPKPFLPIGMGSALAPVTGAGQTVMGVGQSFYYGSSILQTGPLAPIGKALGFGKRAA